MKNKATKPAILAAILLATLLPVHAQMPASGKPATSFVIASPNTRESLTDQDAEASLQSFEQANAVAVADRIACSLAPPRGRVGLSSAIGVYDASAENSFIVEASIRPAEIEYLAALLGRYSHQEFVLTFVADAGNGSNNDRLWIIRAPRPLDAAIAVARRLHLTPLTARKTGSGIEIWIADIGNKLASQLTALAGELQATTEVHTGHAELPGDPDRIKAQHLFDKKLRALEKRRKQRLSAYLWSKGWHDATTRTCSAEIAP